MKIISDDKASSQMIVLIIITIIINCPKFILPVIYCNIVQLLIILETLLVPNIPDQSH